MQGHMNTEAAPCFAGVCPPPRLRPRYLGWSGRVSERLQEMLSPHGKGGTPRLSGALPRSLGKWKDFLRSADGLGGGGTEKRGHENPWCSVSTDVDTHTRTQWFPRTRKTARFFFKNIFNRKNNAVV